jgi:hypothetical protein
MVTEKKPGFPVRTGHGFCFLVADKLIRSKNTLSSYHQLRGEYYGMVASDEFEEKELDKISIRYTSE